MLPDEQRRDDGAGGTARTLRKWGPFTAIIAAVALLGVIVVIDDGDADGETVASTGQGSSTSEVSTEDDSGAPEPTGSMPITWAEAVEAGTEDDHEWGDDCDFELGTVMIPDVHAPPCVPVFEGDNGGEVGPGVTADTIRIVYYDASESGGLDSLLGSAGLQDTPEQQWETVQDWMEIHSSTTETYGREIELVRYEASGGFDDVVAAQADAERIAQDIEPFAVLGGPPSDGGAFADELARNGIICLGCAIGLPECKVRENAPYTWGSGAATSHFVLGLMAWVEGAGGAEGLSGNAVYAGSPELQATERSIGVVHFDQDPPIISQCPGESFWGEDWPTESYLLDFTTMPQVAAEIVTKMKGDGVTTIVFGGDPLMPIYLTGAAEAIDYHPEWVFTGTVLTDTNSFARLYDQNQMAHAFGVAQTGVPVASDEGGALDLYRWYFGEDAFPDARAGYAVVGVNVPTLLRGIHLAGPELTPETFERAQFRLPPTGGDPVNPQVSYGNWGFFPELDYNGVDDLAEIWWDPDAEGYDENDRFGKGMWRYAHGGARFTPQNPPTPAPFVVEDTVTRFEELPPEARPPSYPPPAGSPAAGG